MTAIPSPSVPFDSADPSMRFHDIDVFEMVRKAGGIAWTEAAGGMWVVGRFDLIKRITKDERFRSSEGVRFPRADGIPKVAALEYDRPDHTAHRELMTSAIGPRTVGALQPMVRSHARRLIASLRNAEIADLGGSFAFPLPLDVIFSIVGAPADLKERVVQVAESLFLYRAPMPDGSDPVAAMREIFDGLVAEKLAKPGDDWLSGILRTRAVGGVELSDAELHGAMLAFLAGGHHSTSRGIACLLVEIVKDPGLQRRLREEPNLIPAIAEESLRLNTPLRWFARTASEDIEIGGQLIRAGDRVYLMYAAGNLDPAVFDEPLKLDPQGRKNSEHLAFGWGLHRCVGMPLAQMQLRIAVEELLAATEDICFAGEVEWSALVEPRYIPVRLVDFVPPED
ncbi:cytochrome P450 [Nocardia sp. NPDC052112]|uniref:cytochrome P450 n=1 Tax=Nocardia sp. NPDC052112 TaxID=3155646 RepID=UPI00343C3664